mgnify:CR=1 FL=1
MVLVVILRYGFQIGSIALQESITYLNCLIFTLGGAYTLKEDAHVRVDIVYSKLTIKKMAFIDVISPCVAFNNHVGSTKSYEFTRDHLDTAVNADLILTSPEVTADYEEGAREDVAMPDGSTLRLYKLDADYDPHDRVGALNYVQKMQEEGTVVTGLLYVDSNPVECHDIMGTVKTCLLYTSDAADE